MRKRIPKDIQRIEVKDYKSTGTYSIQKRRKIQSGDKCIWTCYWRSSISGTRKKMETDYVFIKNNVGSQKELQDI